MLTIVMYHYVRDLRRSRFPGIKGLDLSLFREQLDYLVRNYQPVTMEQVLAAYGGEEKLPKNAVLLTFDDGYVDHYQYVFPLLDERKLQGSFFPPGAACLERRTLGVNKIHYALAAVPDGARLLAFLFEALDTCRKEGAPLESNDDLYSRLAIASRLDPADHIFIKRLLQVALPEPWRRRVTDALFSRFVTADDAAFAQELYLSLDQLRCMRRHGMYIGSHTYDHEWLTSLEVPARVEQLDRSLDFLRQVGCDTTTWVLCYPYGAHDPELVELLRARGCRLGLTTEVGLASPEHDRLTLPRLDTNDLPKQAGASPNNWTLKARNC